MLSFIEHQDQIDISPPPTQLLQSRKYLRKKIKIRNKLTVQKWVYRENEARASGTTKLLQ